MANLLKNPGFEADWGDDESHRVVVALPDGTTEWRTVGNIFTPPGFTPWFYHDPGNYDQPEVRDARNAERVNSGEKAMLLFTFYRKHLGGFLQEVKVTPGGWYAATAMAHAWSNWQDGPHEDDGEWSEGPGYDPGFLLEGSAPNDEWRNFVFSVGIDPTGGTNPMADSVVWGDGAHIYNEYHAVPPVQVQAQGDTVTLFLRSRTEWPYKHNDAYWDDARLEEVPEGYFSEIRVAPQNATLDQWLEICTIAYETLGSAVFSYDDAGRIADHAILYNIPKDKQQDFIRYFEERYPKCRVTFDYTSDWSEPSKWADYLLWQGDPRWGDVVFGPGNCTIKNSGCYITALASAQRIYGIDTEATPATVNDALGTDGYAPDCNTKWSAVKDNLWLTISTSTKSQADAHINGGGVMLIEVLPKDLQHFALAVEVLGDDNYLVLDPYKNVVAPLKDLYPGWESWRMITKGGGPGNGGNGGNGGPQLPEMDTLVSLHLQTRRDGDAEFVRQAGRSLVKTFSFEDAAFYESINPNVETIVRMFTREQHIGPDPAKSAADYIATFHDSLMKFQPHYIEGWNETIGSSDLEALKWFVEFEKHFAYQIAALGIRTRACGLNVAVGNPLEEWVQFLIPAARALYETGGLIGYHGYWWGNPGADVLHEMRSWWPWHAGRALEGWDPIFTAHGIFPSYAFTESGIVGSPDGYSLNAHAGWRSSRTLKGDWGRYYQQNALLKSLMQIWNATHGNRARCATLFTSAPPWMGWGNFDIAKPEMESLATLP